MYFDYAGRSNGGDIYAGNEMLGIGDNGHQRL